MCLLCFLKKLLKKLQITDISRMTVNQMLLIQLSIPCHPMPKESSQIWTSALISKKVAIFDWNSLSLQGPHSCLFKCHPLRKITMWGFHPWRCQWPNLWLKNYDWTKTQLVVNTSSRPHIKDIYAPSFRWPCDFFPAPHSPIPRMALLRIYLVFNFLIHL